MMKLVSTRRRLVDLVIVFPTQKDVLDWNLASASPVAVDHSYGTSEGHYMVTEMSTFGNELAMLVSPPYPPTTGSCLRFWYNDAVILDIVCS